MTTIVVVETTVGIEDTLVVVVTVVTVGRELEGDDILVSDTDVLGGTSSIGKVDMLVEVLGSIGSLEISSSLAILGRCSLLERPVSVRCNESLLTRFSSVLYV